MILVSDDLTHDYHLVNQLSESGQQASDRDELKSNFPVYHSRAMRMDFIDSFGKATGVKSGFLREVYHQLTGDCATATNMLEEEVDRQGWKNVNFPVA